MSDPSCPSFLADTRVEFSDTDAAGLLHFSTYFRFMELAEAALFRELDIPLLSESKGEFYGFPRIDVNCRFSKPLYFQDKVMIETQIKDLDSHSITYQFKFFRGQIHADTKTAKGSMRVAFVQKAEDGKSLIKSEIPQDWISRLQTYHSA